MKEPTLGMIELKSVARGIVVTDAIAKKAQVKILEAHAVQPGKFIILICGEVADVEESLKEGVEVGSDFIINYLFLPYIHRDIIPALKGNLEKEKKGPLGSVGILESFSMVSCVRALDIALKNTPLKLLEVRLAKDLGGKAYFVLSGLLADVQDSLKLASDSVKEEGMLTNVEIIPNPHSDLIEKGLYW